MRFLVLFVLFSYSCSGATKRRQSDSTTKKILSAFSLNEQKKDFCKNVIGLVNPVTVLNENFVFDSAVYLLRLDTVPQVKFWRKIMNMHQDSAIFSVASSRECLQNVALKNWSLKPDSLKKVYRDSIRLAKNLDTTDRILITSGKKFFYDFSTTSQNFNKGIHCFIENGVDPWYAQAILLIESPNKVQKSNAGAYGSFQLMKDVARLFGLKVSREIDERADFERSAFAASSLIKKVCIPKAHQMLDSLHISNQNETELWFKLLVMHVYHAGSYNVQNALYSFNPREGNMNIIYNLWHASTHRFKNASQNYSQLVLAAMLEMNERKKLAPLGS
jgi:hypothetical protein